MLLIDLFYTMQCTLNYGHIEREHSTQHGNMNLTRFIAEDDEFEYPTRYFGASFVPRSQLKGNQE